MALTIVEFLRAVNPNIGLVVNPDGSYRIGVEDVNSDEILASLVASGVDLAAIEVLITAINTALQPGGVTNAQLAALLTDIVLSTGTNAIGRIGHDTTGLGDGRAFVTTAGTDVALAGSTPCKWVIITAETNNTSIVCVGATGVDAALATRTGIPLYAGESVTVLIDNLADVFIDALVNTEGVSYMYGT